MDHDLTKGAQETNKHVSGKNERSEMKEAQSYYKI